MHIDKSPCNMFLKVGTISRNKRKGLCPFTVFIFFCSYSSLCSSHLWHLFKVNCKGFPLWMSEIKTPVKRSSKVKAFETTLSQDYFFFIILTSLRQKFTLWICILKILLTAYYLETTPSTIFLLLTGSRC